VNRKNLWNNRQANTVEQVLDDDKVLNNTGKICEKQTTEWMNSAYRMSIQLHPNILESVILGDPQIENRLN